MNTAKIFVTRRIAHPGLRLLEAHYRPDVWSADSSPARDELIERARGVDGLLCMLTDAIDSLVMDAAGPQLKVISNMAVGVDNVDLPAATARKIPVGHTPDVLTDATADQAIALMLAAARRVVEAREFVRAGKWSAWSPNLMLGVDFSGATLGIVGFGRIGQAIARRAKAFDMRVLYFSPSSAATAGAQKVDIGTLLRESDFVSINAPLTTATRHLVNAEFLSKMKRSAVLVNTARGGLLDQAALFAALKSNSIFAAALDVTDPEPLPMDSPLLELNNCIIVPHLGSATGKTRDKMAVLAAENLIAGLRGERLPHCANPEVY